MDTAQIAKNFNVNKSTVQGWVASGCPVAVVGKPGRSHQFDITQVRAWRARKIGKLDPQEERARKDKAQADNVEIRNQVLLGNLLERESVESHWSDMVGNARAKLLALPTKLATVAVASESLEEIQHAAEKLVKEALTELAGDPCPSQAGLDAAAGSDSEPMGGQIPETESGGVSGAGSMAD